VVIWRSENVNLFQIRSSENYQMNPALYGMWEQMRHLGLGALAHANRHAAYYGFENSKWPELSVLQAAHAAELLIKARIAQEHPLLIFNKLPYSPQAPASTPLLELEDLLTNGHTFDWSDLPSRLWAVTGMTIPKKTLFENFGKLRNRIQHFNSDHRENSSDETLRFVFELIDPFINECWGLFAVDYDEDHEPYVYFIQSLVNREILFLVSPEAAATFNDWDIDWSVVTSEYRDEVFLRVQKAQKANNFSNASK
jgi:hypothetical protein